MTVIPAPELEPDATVHEITGDPQPGEPGSWKFARDIAFVLVLILPCRVTRLTERENPYDRRPCPRIWAYDAEFICGRDHQHATRATLFDVYDPLVNTTMPGYGLSLDHRPVTFDPTSHHQLPWQIARAIRTAVIHQHRERLATPAGEIRP
ncbi:hypothetical protein [Cryptosporangium sp. NPDC048952]|uniref:hypothetical protein n=1 Tax=Cryptosporangium sp. NPDC048952 TaxID=3363961 RepID=UPI00371D9146